MWRGVGCKEEVKVHECREASGVRGDWVRERGATYRVAVVCDFSSWSKILVRGCRIDSCNNPDKSVGSRYLSNSQDEQAT